MITVLSVPRTGTRFLLHFITEVLGVEAQYVHFFERNRETIRNLKGSVIMPVRDDDATRTSWPHGHYEECFSVRDEYIPPHTITISLSKSEANRAPLERLLRENNLQWTDAVEHWFNEWRPVGSQHEPEDERNRLILNRFMPKPKEP